MNKVSEWQDSNLQPVVSKTTALTNYATFKSNYAKFVPKLKLKHINSLKIILTNKYYTLVNT
jgi:hypothetical protein